MAADPGDDPRLTAAMDMLRRTGMSTIQIRHDEGTPTVWSAVGCWYTNEEGRPVAAEAGAVPYHEVASALDPVLAVVRLLDRMTEGGQCAHCGRPTGVAPVRFGESMPHADIVCWYAFDPDTASYRRACEERGSHES